MKWTWVDSVNDYGYLSCLAEDLDKTLHPFIKPKGYSEETLAELMKEAEGLQGSVSAQDGQKGSGAEDPAVIYPDIILILNETFYDFDVYADIQTDRDSLESFYNIEDAWYGQCVVPNMGGGTNNTEYEILTGNAMALLGTDAPFNYIDFNKDTNNLVQYMELQGYATLGMHCGGSANYARNKAYPAIGFDTVRLGRGQFTYRTYGERIWLDSDNYTDMLQQYEKMGNRPRFVWLLTYQNHAWYEQNPAEYDTVHVTEDRGELTEQLNEFLTSLSMSADAVHELTDHYRTVERPVIICMLGDHAPAFINGMFCEKTEDQNEIDLRGRTVPWMKWSNYELDKTGLPDTISTFYLAPTLMELAGIPLPEYYRIMLPVRDMVPVCTGSGVCMDRYGNTGILMDGTKEKKLMDLYYYMEYSLLSR